MKQRVIHSPLGALKTSLRQIVEELQQHPFFECRERMGPVVPGELGIDEQGSFYVLTNGQLFRPSLDAFKTQIGRQSTSPHQSNLARALKLHKSRDHHIWDMSAGLGQDLLLMRHYQASQLTAFERHPIVYVLLKGHPPFIEEDITLLWGDPTQGEFEALSAPDVIFFDPMFPEKRKKSALSKKGMELFKLLVGEDLDAAEALERALQLCRDRVVVKRPPHAPALRERPSFHYESKTIRYDVYLRGQ